MSEVVLDAERQKKAKQYARIERKLFFVDLAIGGVYVLAWLIFGWSIAVKNALSAIATSDWFLVAGVSFVFVAILYVIDLPLSYYSGFVLPHRFELSTQTIGGWISDQIKEILLGGIFGFIVIEVIYAVLRAAPETWWLWAAALMLLFTVVLANLSPILIMPLFYKIVPLGDEYADLAARLMWLAEQAHTKVRGVYKFDMSRRTKAANAALMGLGNTRRIVLGDTLLNEFSADEIESVLAHELGHHVNKDIPIGIVTETASTVIGLWIASVVMNWGVSVFGYTSPADPASLPLFVFVMGLFGLITMPLGNAFSRWREGKADAYALQATHNPRAFIGAMTRLANQNLGEVDPEPWEEFLLHSHPALGKRIKMAEAYKG
ncbi:MAG TPA: M48 family metallopeptidase [Anaerolineae bacterium]|nr:M48 family metallopeptidase [Anaerolineae bacterium]